MTGVKLYLAAILTGILIVIGLTIRHRADTTKKEVIELNKETAKSDSKKLEEIISGVKVLGIDTFVEINWFDIEIYLEQGAK
jgi:hypothetical protein